MNLQEHQKNILGIIQDSTLSHEQTMMQLSNYARDILDYPADVPAAYFELAKEGMIDDMAEAHAPYSPRYILPDYEKLMKEGCEFLRLTPPTNLYEAITTLMIFYRHVPSVTHFPVYVGNLGSLLEPFMDGVSDADAKMLIKGFLMQIDRMITDSFCHANIGPERTRAAEIILECERELQDSTPNITLLYDEDITPDDFLLKCAEADLDCAKPSFARRKMFLSELGENFGIASCYNGLYIGGGAFTLSRMMLNVMAGKAENTEDFFARVLPETIDTMCGFMAAKIRFIVEETPFFRSNFLVKEGFINQDRFVGLFGMVGLNECVNTLMQKSGKEDRYGYSEEADALGIRIMDFIDERVKGFTCKYNVVNNGHFLLHAQVGMAYDHREEVSPGVRIPIGSEIPLYDHLRHAGKFHKYFPSGCGDIFPFEATAANNPEAVVDIIKGAFKSGLRYFSTYTTDSDVIRITGYLVKKSDIAKLEKGEAVLNDTVALGLGAKDNCKVYERKVRSL